MSPPRTWPERTSICLDCRTLLAAEAPCPHGAHRTASLRAAGGREALLTRVWGPKSLRDRIRDASRAGAIAGGSGGVLDGCSGCDVGGAEDVAILAVVVALFAAGFLLWFFVRWLIDAVRRWRMRRARRPQGASRAPLAAPSTGCIGTIVASQGQRGDPVDGWPCVAFGLILTHDRARRGQGTMLRDGATLGFEVELGSGERVRIPAGSCVIDGSPDGTQRQKRSGDLGMVRYLKAIDPQRIHADDLEPFPSDHAELVTLRAGDRIEILTPLVRSSSAQLAPAGYRDAAPALLVPDGAVRLRAVSSSVHSSRRAG